MPHGNLTTTRAPAPAGTLSAALLTLVMRLHFYIGLFVGPFIFIAALTGTLYVLTPQLENQRYAQQLQVAKPGSAQSLAAQIDAAQAQMAAQPEARLLAVRPAPTSADTTRVMFSLPNLGVSQSYAVFIDPATLEIRGQLPVYGTSGILPLRTWLDQLHQNLFLGSFGRIYSELAASWLWVAALGGFYIWGVTRSKVRYRPARGKAAVSKAARTARLRRWHSLLGLALLVGMLFFSVTGLTWSQWAGANIGVWRNTLGWHTPVVSTSLEQNPTTGSPDETAPDEHAEHQGHMMHHAHHSPQFATSTFDQVINAARHAGISANKLEIRPGKSSNQAWTVTEIERHWPTQADAVAVSPTDFAIIDHVRFSDYPLAAKLTRWGIDAHMGILFGLPNQLLLAAFGLGLCVMILWGYRMWWLKRARIPANTNPASTLLSAFLTLPIVARVLLTGVVLMFAWNLPVMGASLLLFMVIDVLRWYRHQPCSTAAQDT